MRVALISTTLLTLVACGEEGGPPASASTDLGAAASWTLDPRALSPTVEEPDSLAAHRPSEPQCPAATWGPEAGSFEVETGACDYAAFATALPAPIQAGATLSVVLWHDRLDAEPSTAHVAVWAGPQVLWETLVPIPAPSASIEARVSLTRPIPAGTALGFHLHNHGFNSWRLLSMELRE